MLLPGEKEEKNKVFLSTEEKIVGKILVNGVEKNVYKKTIQGSINHTSSNMSVTYPLALSDFNILNVEKIWIDTSNSFIEAGGDSYCINGAYAFNSNIFFSFRTAVNLTQVNIDFYFENNLNLNAVITVRYTKTTD